MSTDTLDLAFCAGYIYVLVKALSLPRSDVVLPPRHLRAQSSAGKRATLVATFPQFQRGQPFPITNPNPTDSLAISTAKLQLHTKQPLRPASPGNLHRKWISVPWPMTAPLSVSDLIFSSAATDFNRVLGELKRSTLTLGNRLRSIQHDAAFVATVSAAYGLPLVANERCGSWYIAPERKAQSAYFKSTDGHIHQWSFSLRRLNLQVLETVVMHGGCVVQKTFRILRWKGN